MLKLENITKDYRVGDMTVHALRGVSLEFRRSEFVAVLGHSGCGKTTLLNIIGGLDRYTSGDVAINGRSTKNYKDRDWDSYRNHSVGFVFQSYNLIPHQSVLRNVELALTIAGVSKEERTRRAKKALSDVGLADQLKKRPNQLSGGQMQRVAIARALVNDPEILLADEPTGALDSETSVQVMEILKKVAEKRLVVMVTHNPELAEKYATRIVRLKDGLVTDDSDPCSPETEERDKVKSGRARMGFLTSLSLSLNNLMTKKGRTVLTAFAGSIGIIGIALILSMSNGVNKYIDDIQRETMTSYPITIQSEAVDLSGLMGMRSEMMRAYSERGENADRTGINAGYSKLEAGEALSSSVKENNLTAFKRYLDDPESEINGYIGENGVVYSYDVDFNVYAYDPDGKLIDTDSSVDDLSGGSKSGFSGFFAMSSMMGRSSVGAKNFTELMPGADGLAVSRVVTDNYELLYGNWPEKLDEVDTLTEAIGNLETTQSMTWEQGVINSSSGKDSASTTRIRTIGFIDFDDLISMTVTNDKRINIFAYNSLHNYIGNTDWLAKNDVKTKAQLVTAFPTIAFMRVIMMATSASDGQYFSFKANEGNMVTSKWREEVTAKCDTKYRFDGKFLVIAYSSISGGPPINTKEHFAYCAEHGFDGLKTDVRITSDNKIILCHDAGFTFDQNGRITNYNASDNTPIHDLTYAECVALE
ncbi:MAG: ATP-binding cassette domain-containing protein, partial [Oscillospiraceae bacterium]|nr:ATP-binding cassette domain-containing protein [Oscillospiraceae bacterium]